MPSRATRGSRNTPRTKAVRPRAAAWKLEDAKARFSEVVRRARSEGPQRVTVRGENAVVVIAAETFDRLVPPAKSRQTLVEFLQGLGIGDLDMARERDTGRDVEL